MVSVLSTLRVLAIRPRYYPSAIMDKKGTHDIFHIVA